MREFYGILRKQTLISLHFLALSFVQLLELVLRLVWILVVELLFLTSPSDKDTSSTYFQIQDSGSEILKFLIITKNNIGPSFVPWGTPAFIGSQWEIEPANLTRCRRLWLDRKLIIHGIKDVWTPKSRSFSVSTLYPIRSKALEKSRKQRRRCRPGGSRYVSQVWIMSSKQYVVESRRVSVMTTAVSCKTHLDALAISRCLGDDTFVAFQPMGIFRFWRNREFTFLQRCLQSLYFYRSLPPT